ncbi:MAG TPA: GGDEF domain-containing protein [Burkholderiaceae bacterium]|nr:GGDEF domain-containing protein [Burkholderiaceae bacterium]
MQPNLSPMLWLVGFQMGLYAFGWFLCSLLLKEDRAAVGHWGVFLLLVGVVMLLAGMRGEPRHWLFYNGANVLSLVAFAAVRRGIERFMRVSRHDLEQATVLVLVGGAIALLGPSEEHASWRVILTYGCQGYLMLRAMWGVRRALRLEFGPGTLAAIVAPGLLISVLLATLALKQAFDFAHPMEMQRNTAANYGLMYYYLGGSAMFNFGFMVLLTQRLVVKLQQSSRRDALTGLFNRRALDEELQRTWQRHQRGREAFAMLVADIDHFKQINDTYGHAAGDRVLTSLARILQGHARGTDIVGRIGGDEILIVLPKANLHEAERFAERLRRLVEAETIRAGTHALHVTISIGMARVEGGDASIEAVIARADTALYRAKGAGRNRVDIAAGVASVPLQAAAGS